MRAHTYTRTRTHYSYNAHTRIHTQVHVYNAHAQPHTIHTYTHIRTHHIQMRAHTHIDTHMRPHTSNGCPFVSILALPSSPNFSLSPSQFTLSFSLSSSRSLPLHFNISGGPINSCRPAEKVASEEGLRRGKKKAREGRGKRWGRKREENGEKGKDKLGEVEEWGKGNVGRRTAVGEGGLPY